MPRSDRHILSFTVLLSLILHAIGFGLAWQWKDSRALALTPLRLTRSDEAEEIEEEVPDEPDEFTPGIENGAPAVVAWVGYDTYQEHLARQAEFDQAAFTMSDGGAVGQPQEDTREPVDRQSVASRPEDATMDSASEPPSDAPRPSEATELVSQERVEEPAAPLLATREDSLERLLQAQRIDVFELLRAQPVNRERSETAEPKPAVEADSHQPKENEKERESEAPVAQPAATADAPSGSAPKPGEAHDTDAQPAEKESTATSRKKVLEVDWNNGQPLAVEGMEVKPYSLYRHVVLDSKDTLFSFRGWGGRMRQNPQVEIAFDRQGRVGSVKILRATGYQRFDELYLESWMSRWRAEDPRLVQLEPGQLTNPIRFNIVFFEEKPKP